MNTVTRSLSLLLIAATLTGCAAMKEGMENLNNMAVEQAAIAQQNQVESWKNDVERGHYSGTVRVIFLPVISSNSAQTGINAERATSMLRESFADHQQFELLNEQDAERLERDLNPVGGSLSASRVNSGAERRAHSGGVDAEVILRSGLRTETFTGINKKTGKIGQGIKVICWTEYMVIGTDEVTEGAFETTNIFESEKTIDSAAASFHATVLDELMIEHLAAQLAQAESSAR